MIIAKIVGGLGNQMFQYAMAKSMAFDNGNQLRIDLSTFYNKNYFNPEGYLLDSVFGVSDKEATASNYMQVLGVYTLALPLIRRGKVAPKYVKTLLSEVRVFHFDNELRKRVINNDAYISGYWQSELYFSRHADLIRGIYNFNKINLTNRTIYYSNLINSCNSVSVHIRRGDYISNPVYSKIYNICGVNYYKIAMDIIKSKMSEAKFFIFTDDVRWVSMQPEFSNCTIASCEDEGSWNDLYMMSQCKHNIIANSSFSWWGAWLNCNNDKMVLCPKIWFNDGTIIKDLLPQTWIKL